MYDWRRMTDVERQQVLNERRAKKLPWHSPPHFDYEGTHKYLISAACYEHAFIIGKNSERLTECEQNLISVCQRFCRFLYAWCILPNHYHTVVQTARIKELRNALGEFHGQSAFRWNEADGNRGRKVWHNCFERPIRSDRHYWATLNYVHHNQCTMGMYGVGKIGRGQARENSSGCSDDLML